MPRSVSSARRDRVLWVVVFVAVLCGAAVAVTLQYRSSVRNGRRLMDEQSRTLAALLETEVSNVAQYGAFRQERLAQMFENLVEIGAVHHLRLVDEGGQVRVAAGEPWGDEPPTHGVEIRRELVIREAFGASHGTSPGLLAVGGPGSNPSGVITGPATLILQFSQGRVEEIQRAATGHLLGSLLLLLVMGVTSLLWLKATRRSAEAERGLRVAEERSQHLEAINLMASGLAHEIRNPIGAVHGFAQLLAERFPEDTPEGRYARVMLDALDEVSERVTRLLSFARPKKPERKPEDFDELISKVIRLISPDFEQRGVTLEATLDAEARPAQVDASKVKEVALNLLLNALDALEPGGQVAVETRFDPAAKAHVLIVTDDGEGIPAEVQEKVFRPYFTTKSKGSGLGLAICRRIVEDHGGTMTLESAPGSGTRMTAVFPEPTVT